MGGDQNHRVRLILEVLAGVGKLGYEFQRRFRTIGSAKVLCHGGRHILLFRLQIEQPGVVTVRAFQIANRLR